MSRAATCAVEPGIVLDDLNRQLKPHGLWFPVDVSTASRATIGGMAGNNSCGGRSLRYGTMRDNTLSIEAALADGTLLHFGTDPARSRPPQRGRAGARPLPRPAGARRARGGGDRGALSQGAAARRRLQHRRARAERADQQHRPCAGRLGRHARLHDRDRAEALAGASASKALGVCHFGSFYEAMDATQHLVTLKPIAVELVDRTMIALGRDIAMFRPTVRRGRARRSRGAAARRVRRGGPGGEPAPPEATRTS